jgi:hypothetical protein
MVKEKILGCTNVNCSIRAKCKRANLSNRKSFEFKEYKGMCSNFIDNRKCSINSANIKVKFMQFMEEEINF